MEDTAIIEEVQDSQQDPTPKPKKVSIKDFAARVKAKYPDYKDIDDIELTNRVIAKYPEYKEQVDFSSIEKKNPLPNGLPSGNVPLQSGGEDGAKIPKVDLGTPNIDNTVEGNAPVDENIFAQAKYAKELENATKDAGVTGETYETVPDVEAQNYSKKIKENLKAKGIDADELYDETKDLSPQDQVAHQAELLQDRQTNPALYQRKLANLKWTNDFKETLNKSVSDGNIQPDEYNRLRSEMDSLHDYTSSGDFTNQRNAIQSIAKDIDIYGGENKDKIKKNFAIEVSKVYGNAYNNGFDKTIADTPESKYLNSDEQLGLQYLKDVAPEKAGQYDRLMIDPKTLKDNPDAEKGYNHLKQTLEETGIGLQQNSVTEELNSLKKQATDNGGLTPEQLQRATELEKKQDELTQKRNELDQKYPDRIQNKIEDAVNEVMGSELGYGEYALGKTGQAVANTVKGVWEAVSSPFMSDASNTLRELSIMGSSLADQSIFKQPSKNKALLTDAFYIEPDLQKQVDAIKDNKVFTDSQKRQKLNDLFAANPDKFGRVPIKGGKFNVNPSSILYGVTDIGTSLLPFIALETATGGGATAGAARKFLSTFTAAAATTFHDEYANALLNGKSQSDAYKEAMGMTAISSLAMAGANTPSKIRAMLNPQTSAGKLIMSMSDDAIEKALQKGTPKGLKSIGGMIKERAKAIPEQFKEGVKTGAQFEVAMNLANEAKSGLYGTEIDREQNFKQSLLGIANFGIIGVGAGQLGFKSPTELQKGALVMFGEKPKEYISVLDQLKKDGKVTPAEYDHRKSLIESAETAYKKLPQNLDEKQKSEYLYQTVIKDEANKGKADLPPKQAAEAEKTAMVADHTRGIILENPTDKQLNDRKSQLEKKLEPKKDAEGKDIELPEKDKLDLQAELEAINNTIESNKKEVPKGEPEQITKPIELSTETPTEQSGKENIGDKLIGNGFKEDGKGGLEKDGVRIAIRKGSVLGIDQNGDVINVDSKNESDIVLKEINIVDEAARGKGNATGVLRDFLNAADEAGNTIYIEPTPIAKFKDKNNLTAKQLEDWYSRHGFEKINESVWRRKPKAKINETDANADFENRLTYEEADRYRKAIKNGEQTADEVIKSIERAGFIVPKDIREQSTLKQQSGKGVVVDEGVVKPTFENVAIETRTPEEINNAKNEIFNNASRLNVGQVIDGGDNVVKVVTDNSIDSKGNHRVGIVTFERQPDGSLIQRTNQVWVTKNSEGKINVDYNPHETGTNSKGERVTTSDKITDNHIDLSKEKVFIEDADGNLVQTKAFESFKPKDAPQSLSTKPEIKNEEAKVTEDTNATTEAVTEQPMVSEAAQPTEGEERITGVKKEITNATRAANNMPKVEFHKMTKDAEALSEAKERIDSGKVNPQEMVDRILKEKGNYKNEDEVMDMQYYAYQLEKQNHELSLQLAEAKTPEEQADIRQRKLQVSDLMDAQTEAAQTAGNQWGKTGNRMQPVINDAGQIFRNNKANIKEAYGGEVPEDVQKKIDAITKERDDAIEQRDKVEAQLKKKMAERGFEEMKKKANKNAKNKEEKEKLKQEEQDLLKELKKSLKKDFGQANVGIPIPKETLETLGKLAINYLKQGVNGFEALVDKMYDALKDEGISRKDIKDFLATHDPLIAEMETKRLNKKAEIIESKLTPPILDKKGRPSEPTNFAKPSKVDRLFRANNEWVKANQRVANAEFKMKIEKRKALESQKNWFQRGLAWAGRLTRLSVLSGTHVLGKLASAATIGSAVKRIPEQAIGAVYSVAFKGIAKKAPIEGFVNAKSEGRFYKEFFNPKKFAKNAYDILKSGSTELGRRLGSAEYEHVPILYIPTDLHQIIKDPPKRATFEASFRNGLIWAEKNGLDINDPLVINSIENAAYKRAQYEIFQEQNWLSKKFTSYKSSLEKAGNTGSAVKFLVDFMIPVSTVPTNIARRLVTTSPLGLIRGGKDVVQAYRKGIENLQPDEADAVMKQLKQGSLGTALWLAGWFGYQYFGGLYSRYNPNAKRDEEDLKSDVMMIGGKEVPVTTQHALPLEVIQLASTARRVYENYRQNKNATNTEALTMAGLSSIGAVAESIPVIETPVNLVLATQDPKETAKLREDIDRRVMPQLLREQMDKTKGSEDLKFLHDKGLKIVPLHKEGLQPIDENGKRVFVTDKLFNKVSDLREEKITQAIAEARKNGFVNWETGETIPADKITTSQFKGWLMSQSTKAKNEAIDEVFGVQPDKEPTPKWETNQ